MNGTYDRLQVTNKLSIVAGVYQKAVKKMMEEQKKPQSPNESRE